MGFHENNRGIVQRVRVPGGDPSVVCREFVVDVYDDCGQVETKRFPIGDGQDADKAALMLAVVWLESKLAALTM